MLFLSKVSLLKPALVLAALLPVLAVEGAVQEVELPAIADTTLLFSANPPKVQNYLNYGASLTISASRYVGRDRGTALLLRFDLSAVPSGAKLRKATLQLIPAATYAARAYQHGERLEVWQVAAENEAWEEGTGEGHEDVESAVVTTPGANAAYLNMESYQSEIDHFGTRWLSGERFGAMDREGARLGEYLLGESGLMENSTILMELDVTLLRSWLANPDLPKAGLWITMSSGEEPVEASRFAIFQSRESGQPPQLVLEYETP